MIGKQHQTTDTPLMPVGPNTTIDFFGSCVAAPGPVCKFSAVACTVRRLDIEETFCAAPPASITAGTVDVEADGEATTAIGFATRTSAL